MFYKKILLFLLILIVTVSNAFIGYTEQSTSSETIDINNLVVREDRSAYASDESFANLRPIVMGDIAEGVLYRSSSPIGGLGEERARVTDSLLVKVGINTVMNMAFTKEEVSEILSAEPCPYPNYKALFDQENISATKLPYYYKNEGFSEALAEGIIFLADNDPPYLFHCHGGKDRTGFLAMILEMLMGASKEEIIADYMETYTNLYGIQPGTEAYTLVSERNIIETMNSVIQDFGSPTDGGVDLRETAKTYLLSTGLTQDTLERLTEKLKTPIAH